MFARQIVFSVFIFKLNIPKSAYVTHSTYHFSFNLAGYQIYLLLFQISSTENWIAQYCNVSGSQCTIVILILVIVTVGVLQFDRTEEGQDQDQGHHSGMPEQPQQTPRPRRRKPPACQPKLNIAFYNTNEAGSGPISNILYRLALQRNLLVAPFSGTCFRKEGLGNEECPLNFLSDIYYSRLGEPNIFIEKDPFNEKSTLRKVIPNNAIFMTHFTGPVTMNTKKKSDPGSHSNTEDVGKSADWKPWFPWKQLCQESNEFQNVSTHCLNSNKGDCIFAACKATIHKFFPLIMMPSHMTESLILIRRNMCWTHEDIVYLTLNSSHEKGNSF